MRELDQVNNAESLTRLIREALDERIEKALSDMEADIVRRVHKAVRAQVGEIALSVMNHYSFERQGNYLIIRVQVDA